MSVAHVSVLCESVVCEPIGSAVIVVCDVNILTEDHLVSKHAKAAAHHDFGIDHSSESP